MLRDGKGESFMKRHELVRALLHKASQDEAAMAALLPELDLDDELIGFHAQQAVEKLLKALLAYNEIDYPRVHSLQTLMELLAANGCPFPEGLEDVSDLTPFATIFRYEVLPFSTKFDRDAALELVRRIRGYVENRISEGRAAG